MTTKTFPGDFFDLAGDRCKIFAGRKQFSNLAKHLGDQTGVAEARALLANQLGCEIQWLKQVHGNDVLDVEAQTHNDQKEHSQTQDPIADAAITGRANSAIAILTADCLPVMFADVRGCFVAGAHAGWRGLVNGVLDKTINAFVQKGIPAGEIRAFFGPAIGANAFEVGDEVKQTFANQARPEEMQATLTAFVKVVGSDTKWLANLCALAAIRLARFGVLIEHAALSQSTSFCTYSNPETYFSYRYFCHHPQVLDGRQATLIWRSP